MKAIKITSAKYLFDYRIRFEFSNGKTTTVDFEAFLSAPRQNPMNSKYLDISKFKKFKILNHNHISWGRDMEMCFPFETLYKGGSIPPPDRNKIKKMTIAYFGKKKAEKMFAEAEIA